MDTVFIGGGTPTLLKVELWVALLEGLGRAFDLSEIRAGRGEFTVECNPETASAELFSVLAEGEVDRISLGAQSFNPQHLATLERRHNPDRVPEAIDLARAAGIDRQSIDLIYAIPGQTTADLDRDLDRALALGTEHISAYALTYEPGTAMTARLHRGQFEPAPDELEVEMMDRVADRLADAGLEQYEISNYARPGAESRHNLAYWKQHQWIALGPSASAHVGGHRWKNVPRLDDYLAFDDEGFASIAEHEEPDAARALAERIMTGLRIRDGLDGPRVIEDAESLDPAAPDRLRQVIAERVGDGHLEAEALTGGRWVLTRLGSRFADGIAAELMACLP